MANEAQLIARVEARLDTFEKQLQKAGVMADGAVKDIENKFSRMDLGKGVAVGAALGGFLGTAAGKAVDFVTEKIGELIDQFARLQRTAQFTGISLGEVFTRAAALGGISEFTSSLEAVAIAFDRLQRGERGGLSELLTINNVALSSIKTATDLYDTLVELIVRANNEIQAREIGRVGGFSATEVENIRKRGTAYFEEQQALKDVVAETERLHAGLASIDQIAPSFMDKLKLAVGVINDLTGATAAASAQISQLARDLARTTTPQLGTAPSGAQLPEGRLEPSKPPPVKTAETAAAAKERLSSLEKLTIESEKQRKLAESELTLLGASNIERAKARGEIEAQAAVQRDVERGLKLAPELIKQRTDAIIASVAAEEEFKQKVRDTNEIVSSTKNIMSDALKTFVAALREGKNAADAMRASLERISERLLDKALDLALNMAFSGNVAGTGTGGGFGALLAGLFKTRMAGGPVTAGGTYLVGERGPELLRMGNSQNGMIIPNAAIGGGYGGVNVTVINNGAQVTQSSQRRPDGGTDLKIMIDAAVSELISTPGTSTNRVMRMGTNPLIRRS